MLFHSPNGEIYPSRNQDATLVARSLRHYIGTVRMAVSLDSTLYLARS